MLLNQLKIKDAVPQGGLSKITILPLLKTGHPSFFSPACSLFHSHALSCTGSGAYWFQTRSPQIIKSGSRLTQQTEYFVLDKWATLAYLVIIPSKKQELSIWVAEGCHLHPAVIWNHSTFFIKDLPDQAGCMVRVLVYIQRRRQACTAQTYCHIQTVKPCSKPATERGSPIIPLHSHPPIDAPTPSSHRVNKIQEITQGKAFLLFSLFRFSPFQFPIWKPRQEWTTRQKCLPLAGSIWTACWNTVKAHQKYHTLA